MKFVKQIGKAVYGHYFRILISLQHLDKKIIQDDSLLVQYWKTSMQFCGLVLYYTSSIWYKIVIRPLPCSAKLNRSSIIARGSGTEKGINNAFKGKPYGCPLRITHLGIFGYIKMFCFCTILAQYKHSQRMLVNSTYLSQIQIDRV